MISKRFACKKFYNIVFLLYTIHVEASLMRLLGEFQIAQIESLVLKLSKFVKICRTCQSVVEIIGKGGHSSCLLTFIENDSMKLGKNDLCQINHSVLC